MPTRSSMARGSHAGTPPPREGNRSTPATPEPEPEPERKTLKKRSKPKKPPPPSRPAPMETSDLLPAEKGAPTDPARGLPGGAKGPTSPAVVVLGQPAANVASAGIEDQQDVIDAASVTHTIQSTVGDADALNGSWPAPLDQLVRSEMPWLREAVEEWRRAELELDLEEHRRKDQSNQIKRWLEAVGLGQYADDLCHGRYCGPRALAQLKAHPRDEVIQFCESVQRHQSSSAKTDGLAADDATPRGKPRWWCRSRRSAGGTTTGVLLLIGVTAVGMCSSTTVTCAL